MLMLGSKCFGHHYAHHQELTTIVLVTNRPSGSGVAAGWRLSAGRMDECPELTTIALVTTQAVWFSGCCWLEVKCRQDG